MSVSIIAEVDGPLSERKLQEAVKALVKASEQLQDDPQNVKGVENLIQKLKQLYTEDRQKYGYNRLNSETRRKLDSLNNLIRYLESQLERARKVASRRGLKYYLARISSTILGDDMERIAQSIESELQSWLEQQDIEQLVKLLRTGSEDAKVNAISAFEDLVRKGYDSDLQETILSFGLVDSLAALLEHDTASWRVQKEAASALSAVVHFNKDIFVGLMLMVGLVEKLLVMLSFEPHDLSLVALCTLTSMMSAGKGAIVDEVQSKGGVKKLVDFLDDNSLSLQHAAMDCIFEMAYYGRREVVETLMEQGVVEKLVRLQHLVNGMDQGSVAELGDFHVEGADTSSNNTNADGVGAPVQSQKNPFANAVVRFALQVGLSVGLRKREKRALKQEILRKVKEIIPDYTKLADVTADVLWAP